MRVLKRIRDATISNREKQRDGVWKRRNVETFGSGTHQIECEETLLRWYGHTIKMDEMNNVKQTKKKKMRAMQVKKNQRITWMNDVRHDTNDCGLKTKTTPKTGEDGGGWYRTTKSHHSWTQEKLPHWYTYIIQGEAGCPFDALGARLHEEL